MTIRSSEDRMEFVRSFVEDGRYPSEQEVIDEAARLLEEREDQAQLE